MKKKLAAIAVSLLAGTAAYAQNAYVDLAYQTFDSDWSTDPAALRVTAGYVVLPNLAIEGMVGTSAKKGKENLYGLTATVKVDSMVGVYLRPMIPVSDAVELYGRVGYVKLKTSSSVLNYKYTDSDSDFSYGVGVAYSINKNARLFADYTRVSDANALALGLGFRF